jgi:hypothetical protein
VTNERTPSILCTHPGRHGDILWALPTVRALAEAYGTPVDVLIPAQYSDTGLATLINQQPYVRTCWARYQWEVQQTAPITPRVPPASALPQVLWDQTYHLGYVEWPKPTLAIDVYERAVESYYAQTGSKGYFPTLDLTRPWITTPGIIAVRRADDKPVVWVGWSDEWFELKVGLLVNVARHFPDVEFWWYRPGAGRADEVDRRCHHQGCEAHLLGPNISMIRADWRHTAAEVQVARVYLGCLSASWVLANALGIRTVVVEPAKERHHPVFYYDHPRNHLVKGGDGLPTFDARHTVDALREVLTKALQEDRPELRATADEVWRNDANTEAAKAARED